MLYVLTSPGVTLVLIQDCSLPQGFHLDASYWFLMCLSISRDTRHTRTESRCSPLLHLCTPPLPVPEQNAGIKTVLLTHGRQEGPGRIRKPFLRTSCSGGGHTGVHLREKWAVGPKITAWLSTMVSCTQSQTATAIRNMGSKVPQYQTQQTSQPALLTGDMGTGCFTSPTATCSSRKMGIVVANPTAPLERLNPIT